MSNYIYNLGASIERALAGVPTVSAAVVAGYWSNREFWLDEFAHLISVIDGFDERLERMEFAFDTYSSQHDADANENVYGIPTNRVLDPTSPSQRRQDASGARSALKNLAEKALNLKIATSEEYDAFVRRIRVSGRTNIAE